MMPLKFYLGDETHVVKENKEKRNDSLFASQYDYAFKEIKAVLPTICIDLDKDDSEVTSELIPNNVFAFIGDRGTGKTSCMLSVSSMLEEGEEEINKKCLVLDVIDPSFFDNKVNILDIVIGKMFSSFKDSIKKQSSFDSNDNLKSKVAKLYETFQKVRDCLVNIKHQKEISEESVEYLADLVCSVDLQRAMHKLIGEFLSFYKKDLLVIPIDDIDLHTECAYTMIEQIRKYLVQNNVIVLMAVRLDQLRKVIENEYADKYQKSLTNQWIGEDYIRDMAARYLVKFIPQSHRVFMPDMKVYMDTDVQLWDKDKQVWPKRAESLKYAVVELIFKKTRYLFYHKRGVSSPIVPSNLREIRHLIGLLYQMPDYRQDGIKHDENKLAFKHYFFDTWVPNNLDLKDVESIHRIESMRDASIFNKLVLAELKVRFKGVDKSEGWISEIYNDGNASFNISIGDVFSVIDYVKKRWTNSNDSNFIFSLETIYSMRLYEYYDIMTEQGDAVPVNPVDESIKKRSMFDEIKLYHIVAGGSFLNSSSNTYIANDRNGLLRNPRRIKLTKVREWVNTSDSDISKLWAAELVSLFLARRDYESLKKKGVGSNYRTSGVIVYNDSVKNVDNVIFDITSLFYNITNIRQAYERVDEQLFELATNRKDSLYNRLLGEASKRGNRDRTDIWKLLSWGCIRNAEILEDFSDYLSTNVASSSKDDMDNYKDFLEKVNKYEIKTYDRDDNEPYIISFDYVKILMDAMKNDFVKVKLKEIFDTKEDIEIKRDSLTDEELQAILMKVSRIPHNKLGNLTSSVIKNIIKLVVPEFSSDKLDSVFQRNKSYNPEEYKSKLAEMRKL